MNTKGILRNIKVSSKKWWKQEPGTARVYLVCPPTAYSPHSLTLGQMSHHLDSSHSSCSDRSVLLLQCSYLKIWKLRKLMHQKKIFALRKMVIVDHLTYRAIIIEILKLPRNCKMLLLLLKPLVKRSRVISICLVRLQQPSYFVFIKIKKMSVLLPLRHWWSTVCYFAQG